MGAVDAKCFSDWTRIVPADNISVLVPTYRRPQDLERCLEALAAQTRRPAAVVVISRTDDAASREVATAWMGRLPLRLADATRAGQVHALNCGLATVRTALVAFTDDDARPRPDWLERMVVHFENPGVGAVGGRDIVHKPHGIDGGRSSSVGRVRWFGRVVGNHHFEAPLQDVQFLKGTNMAFRRETLPGFDENLAGSGAEACNDMQVSLRVSARGWRVVWDPAVAVDHFPATRFDDDARAAPSLNAVVNVLRNQTYILLSLLTGRQKVAAFGYALFVGSRQAPGPLLLPGAILSTRGLKRPLVGFWSNLTGRLRGLEVYIQTRGKPQFPGPFRGAQPLCATDRGCEQPDSPHGLTS